MSNIRKKMSLSDLIFGVVFIAVFYSVFIYWYGNKEVGPGVYNEVTEMINARSFLHDDMTFNLVLKSVMADEVILIKEYSILSKAFKEAEIRHLVQQINHVETL